MKEPNFSFREIYDALKTYPGAVARLADEHDCTRQWINLVLHGKYEDVALVKKAAEIWVQEAEAYARETESISELVNQARSLRQSVTA